VVDLVQVELNEQECMGGDPEVCAGEEIVEVGFGLCHFLYILII
jgi:hypothetical protein